MNKKILYALLSILSLIAIGYAFNNVNLATNHFLIYTDNTSIGCSDPAQVTTLSIAASNATFKWEDNVNQNWNYFVQLQGYGTPGANAGIATSAKNSTTVSQENNGNPLIGDTTYEFWVKALCDTGEEGNWIGPLEFTTACAAFTQFPFVEGFNSTSTTHDCWLTLDQNKDGEPTESYNAWSRSGIDTYEGDGAMLFSGSSTDNDDWLISPTFTLANEVYELSYYYQTSDYISFEVLLSQNGTATDQFTTVLKPAKSEYLYNFTKTTLYITNTTGDINIAWHVKDKSSSYIALDKVELKKINCVGVEDTIEITDLTTNSARLTWTDNINSSWEFAVVPAFSLPPISGVMTTQKTINITQMTGSTALQANTEYDFYIRSICAKGKGEWKDPITFKTLCMAVNLPFWEGFNANSTSKACWIQDHKNSDYLPTSWNNIWQFTTLDPYEGSDAIYFFGAGAQGKKHDDWLISPSFQLDATKYYKLKFHYKTDAFNFSDFDVLISNQGTETKHFNVLKSYTGISTANWQEQIIIIGKTGGLSHVAWQVKTAHNETSFFLDNVFIEEVSCAIPQVLAPTNLTQNSATIQWQDNFGSNWEYYVVPTGSTIAAATKGTPTTSKSIDITTDNLGNPLLTNTGYDLYVRTICSGNIVGEWSLPYLFYTGCNTYSLPFWEGFNNASTSIRCWEIRDANRDANIQPGVNSWITSTTRFEGTTSMYFNGNNKTDGFEKHDDWLITPVLQVKQGVKTYRLKYNYQLSDVQYAEHQFEIRLSEKGSATQNFTKIIKPEQQYLPTNTWVEDYIFITGITADFQIGWHVTATTNSTDLYIDNVFVEEVIGCPEPLPASLGVKNRSDKSATLFWADSTNGKAWEYYVQKAGGTTPTSKGSSTTTKEVIATTEAGGLPLIGNTDYEFYIRTTCGNGEYSIWSGPFYFTTSCPAFSVPFWEGFNFGSPTSRCWSILDSTNQPASFDFPWSYTETSFEGDRALSYINYGDEDIALNDWYISPRIALDGGQYVLKYNYKTDPEEVNSFEVLLSSTGTNATDFTTVLVPTKNYNTDQYQEEVVFFNSIKGVVNIAWHINSENTYYSILDLDNISLKKVENCAEPSYVTQTNNSTTSIDVSWTENGNNTQWEVLVVDGNNDITAPAIQTITVNTMPQTTITGLQPGKSYGVFVRAKCGNTSMYSAYSTKGKGYTKANQTNTCANAYVVPVNTGLDCIKSIGGSLIEAVPSNTISPDCAMSLQNDVWFEFTATHQIHKLTISDVVSHQPTLQPEFYGAIYDVNCANITSTPILCFTTDASGTALVMNKLIPGTKYYIRLGTENTVALPIQMEVTFNVCITTNTNDVLEVDPSGNKYTYEELIKEVLVQSNCDLVSNVKYQIGDGSPQTKSINTLGYFNKANSIFPFEKGIVLSTGEIDYVSNTFTEDNKGNNPYRWTGDKDLNDAIDDAGGNPEPDKSMRVTQLEFDFIPVIDSIQFDYLFASNSYIEGCSYSCENGALFAAWLIDLETGKGQNLAKIKGTKSPISLATIWDNKKIKDTDCSVNPKLFWMNFSSQLDPMFAPINFAGLTVPMSSETVYVKPGKKYHIKLAVMDFCTNISHTSAVFFKGGSFDLGTLDLGPDLLIETGNALCSGETRTINSGLNADSNLVQIKWFKDGVEIPGATLPSLEVTESGVYTITSEYKDINCGPTGKIDIEIYPPISKIVNKPLDFEVCRFTKQKAAIDLYEATQNMLSHLDKETATNYTLAFYADSKLEQPILDAQAFEMDLIRTNHTVYVAVEDKRTGCVEVFDLTLKGVIGAQPSQPKDVVMCSSYTLPKLESNQYYYTQPHGEGKKLNAGDTLNAGNYTLYIYQDNGNSCFEETSFTVEVIEMPFLQHIDDQTLQCSFYVLPTLPANNNYFVEVNGKRTALQPGTVITQSNTQIFIVVESDDNVCKAQTSFMVRYDDCPIPKGISPNGDGYNDTFDLSLHGVSSIKIFNRNGSEVYSFEGDYQAQWMGQSKSNKALPSGTYYYVIQSFDRTKTGWVQINR